MDETISAIRPGMAYRSLIDFARENTFSVIPGMLRKRFIYVDDDDVIVYDRFLQLLNEHDLSSAFMRKIMYFVWAYRDDRIRRFVTERIADRLGKWRVRELLNKKNSDFFEEWHSTGSATKARSNVEFFLKSTGIFNETSRVIDLDLSDGWLSEAAAVAAQHEDNADDQRKLINDPIGFLIQKNLNGLINASIDELRGVHIPPSSDPSPSEDDTISTSPEVKGASWVWNRKPPKSSGKGTTTAIIDIVARERANKSHHELEKLLAESITSAGYEAKQNLHIDVYFETPAGTCLVEVKSANGKNFHSQVRKAVSQLLEYRYLYTDQVGKNPILVLLIETYPRRRKNWLLEYLESIGILVAWKDFDSSRIVSKGPVPRVLKNIIHLQVI
jgi:hypothetical protein